MDVSHILENLNDPQREAVTSEDKSLLVLAGAGSGKTRVLVHRIAWNVEAMGLNPSSIMAVTFTNKAAQEMQSRIQELLQSPAGDMWCGTFHGLAHFLGSHLYRCPATTFRLAFGWRHQLFGLAFNCGKKRL